MSVAFGADKTGRVPFDSVVDLWNVWYGEYFNETKVPVIVVRFEDLIFFPKEVTQLVCECAGGVLMEPQQVYTDQEKAAKTTGGAGHNSFHYVVGSSLSGPGHGGTSNPKNGLLEAWIKYYKPRKERIRSFSASDYKFAEQELDKRMTNYFGYG